jgi:hypothetical protein
MDEDWGTEPRFQATKVRLRDVLKPRKSIIDLWQGHQGFR